MANIEVLHTEAMNLAEKAFIARRQGDKELALSLLEKAYKKEKEAALEQVNDLNFEPTRSILLRSAASLAIQIEAFSEAEKLIGQAFIGNPPEEIADELRELFDQAQFNRHLKLNGIELGYNQVQLSLAGGQSVGFGIVLGELFTEKVEYLKKLLERTVERLSGQSYRKGGLPRSEVRNKFPVYLSTARAQSFAVTISVGLSNQIELPFKNFPDINILDEVLDCLKLVNNSEEEKLRARIKDDDYYANFIGLARKIAPDGKKIKQVGFTSQHNGRLDYFSLNPQRTLPEVPEPDIDSLNEPVEIEGYLRFADATKGSHEIRVEDDTGKKHKIEVPVSLMNDIVRPLWDNMVLVKGLRREDGNIILKDIEKVD